MPIQIYNSLTQAKENFEPLNSPKLNIYSCGVTVYDDCHIGHARSLYIFEIIKRYLKYRKFDVRFVRNITDIDDKIINRANELKVNWSDLVKKYIDRYYGDLSAMGLEKADAEPRATENIDGMIKHIQGLIDKGYAYVGKTGVYFSVRKFKDYGKLSKQSIDQMLTGVRKDTDETKDDPLDFALWKLSKPGEPHWPSPWGEGRPGWHIECSVMSAKYLKVDTLDIHAGGRDLIFPHHENEIAQSEALTGKPFAKYWIHHGLLTINGQKMSKSLGNFVTIKDYLNQYKNPGFLKLFFLSAHYSHPIDYNEEKIIEASKQYKSFDDFFMKVDNWGILEKKNNQPFSDKDKKKIDGFCDNFIKAMDDDFNAPQALASLFELIDYGAKLISSDKEEAFKYTRDRLKEFLGILAIDFKKHDLPSEVLAKIKERALAKKNKDFIKADKIREEISALAIEIIDTATNVTATAASVSFKLDPKKSRPKIITDNSNSS